jgi:hypothetical protein
LEHGDVPAPALGEPGLLSKIGRPSKSAHHTKFDGRKRRELRSSDVSFLTQANPEDIAMKAAEETLAETKDATMTGSGKKSSMDDVPGQQHKSNDAVAGEADSAGMISAASEKATAVEQAAMREGKDDVSTAHELHDQATHKLIIEAAAARHVAAAQISE